MNWSPPNGNDAPLSAWVRDVPDWPQRGVLFRDLTPLWADAGAWDRAVRAVAAPFDANPPDRILGIEARGFLVAAALAARWDVGILLARKPGKLPAAAHRQEYELEYGRASLETHRDLVPAGARVLIADDVLATGGTAHAALALTRALGLAPAGFAFLVELLFLEGRAKLEGAAPVHAVIAYDAKGGVTVKEP
ncbi:MAG: adenine phosphoribosyltransferase [Hyphomicrobiales bacterium]